MPDHDWPAWDRRAPARVRRTLLGGLAALAVVGERLAKAPAALAEGETPAGAPDAETVAAPQENRAEVPPPNTDAPPAIGALELYLLSLVNGARTGRGIAPLEWNEKMASVARAHAEDMMRRSFVSHTGSDGSSPTQRLRRAGIEFRFGSENIWTLRGSTPERALAAIHAAMMSEPHAPGLWNHIGNILYTGYRRIGIGIVLTANGTPYVSEKFAD